ncbi:MAG: ABC transporter permease [Byssovorax sp.]
MTLRGLGTLILRDLGRTGGSLSGSAFGLTAGTAALIFFLALSLGVQKVLLGQVFLIDQIELEPPKGEDPGLLGLLVGAPEPPGISEEQIGALAQVPGVVGVYPKLRMSFPSSARGGKELFGYDVGTSELVGDGIEPKLVAGELAGAVPFEDPALHPGDVCADDGACKAPRYCEKPNGQAEGRCLDPVPVLVSRYLVEIFDKSLAPAHNLPPMGETLVKRAEGVTFTLRIGESLLGKSKRGAPRTARARVIGISRRAIDLGITLPIEVVRRWNRELSSEAAATRYSSAIVQTKGASAVSDVLARGKDFGLSPHDTRARDVSVLITGTTALLSLVAAVILVVSASNIAATFRSLVRERAGEIGLYRAIGATGADMRAWMLGLACTIGALGALELMIAQALAFAVDRLAATKLPRFPLQAEHSSISPALWGRRPRARDRLRRARRRHPARRASRRGARARSLWELSSPAPLGATRVSALEAAAGNSTRDRQGAVRLLFLTWAITGSPGCMICGLWSTLLDRTDARTRAANSDGGRG